MTKISHTAIFAAKNKAGDRVNVITMEDWKNGENDYNDVAFVISSNPIAAIEFRMFLIRVIDKEQKCILECLALKITGRNKEIMT